MKICLFFIFLVLIAVADCKAQKPPLTQIVPVEENIDYINNDVDIPDWVYFKDINHVLDKYVGTWIGNYNDKTYEVHVIEFTDNFLGVTKDMLLMRYKITDANGHIIENTLDLPDDSPMIINGSYISQDLTDYFLYYIGQDIECGQHGDIVIFEITATQMEMYFRPGENIYTSVRCPNGPADQVFPVETAFTLTKQ